MSALLLHSVRCFRIRNRVPEEAVSVTSFPKPGS
jgi:hypothetical protein